MRRPNERKLTARQAIEIAKRYREGVTAPVLAAEYGVGPAQIYNIVAGKSWEIATGIVEPIRHHRESVGCRICGDTHFAKNYCERHYHTHYRPRSIQPTECRLCGDRSWGRGLCRFHYDQWRRLLLDTKRGDVYTNRNWGDDRSSLTERNQEIIDRWLKMFARGETLWAQPAWGTGHQSMYPEDWLDMAISRFDSKRAKDLAKRRLGKELREKVITLCRRTALTIENDLRWALARHF